MNFFITFLPFLLVSVLASAAGLHFWGMVGCMILAGTLLYGHDVTL